MKVFTGSCCRIKKMGSFWLTVLLIVLILILQAGPVLADSRSWGFDNSSDYLFDAEKIEVSNGFAQLKAVEQSPDTATRGLWHLNEGLGTTSTDSSGNNNTATLQNGALWSSGKIGNAIFFDGINDRLRVNDASSLDITNATGVTIEAWVNLSRLTGWQTVVAKGGSNTLNYSLSLYGQKLAFSLRSGGSIHDLITTGSYVTQTEVWYHLAVTFNGTQAKFYVNGALVETVSGSFTMETNNSPLYIGSWFNTDFLQGKIDEVRISATVRSVIAIYDSSSPSIRPNVLQYQPFVSLESFSAVEETNGGSLRYQITNDGANESPSWYWWSGSGWEVTSSQTNSAFEINAHIATFPLGNGKFSFRAFLISNGSQLVKLDLVALGYSIETPTPTATFTPTNYPPNVPSNVTPPNNAVNIDPRQVITLEKSAFSDPDQGDVQAAYQFQVTSTQGNYSSPVYDSGQVSSSGNTHQIPANTLDYATSYWWHVRVKDDKNNWSDWSDETKFTTASALGISVVGTYNRDGTPGVKSSSFGSVSPLGSPFYIGVNPSSAPYAVRLGIFGASWSLSVSAPDFVSSEHSIPISQLYWSPDGLNTWTAFSNAPSPMATGTGDTTKDYDFKLIVNFSDPVAAGFSTTITYTLAEP